MTVNQIIVARRQLRKAIRETEKVPANAKILARHITMHADLGADLAKLRRGKGDNEDN
jgi:hypothetical protein